MNSEHVGHLVSPAGRGNQRPLASIWRLAFRRTVWIWERRLKGGAGGAFRDLWVAVSLAGLVVLAFTLVARSSSNSSHGAMNLNTLLFLFQFCVLVSSIPGRGRGEFFQEPPGPLLPLSSNGLSVYWAARVVGPPAMLLGLAYFGIGLGSKTVAPSAVLLAWLADVTGIAGLLLVAVTVRWAFGTYMPHEVRRVAAFFWQVVSPLIACAVFLLFFLAAARFAVDGRFISTAVEKTIGSLSIILDAHKERLGDAALAFDPVRRLGGGHTSVMTGLLLQGSGAALGAAVRNRIILFMVGVLLLQLPARRREEPASLRLFGHWITARFSDATAALTPNNWRVPARLVLPYLKDGASFVLTASAVLFATALSLTMARARVELGLPLRPLPELVTRVFGSAMAVLAIMSLRPLLLRLGAANDAYARLSALPVSFESLLRRMLLLGMLVAAIPQAVVAGLWARLLGGSWATAIAFSLGTALICAGVLFSGSALQTVMWRHSRSSRDLAGSLWLLGSAGLMVLNFLALKSHPGWSGSIVAIAFIAATAGALLASGGLARMVATREPWTND